MAKLKDIHFKDSIEDAIRGAQEAFAFLYWQTYRYYRTIVANTVGSTGGVVIDDVMQNVYLKIFTGLSGLKDPEAFVAWGASIARREAVNECVRQGALKNSRVEYYSPVKESEDTMSMDDFYAADERIDVNPEAAIDEAADTGATDQTDTADTGATDQTDTAAEEAAGDTMTQEAAAAQILEAYAARYVFLAGNSYDVTYSGDEIILSEGISGEYDYNYEEIPGFPLTYQIYDYDGDGQEELLVIFTELSEETTAYSAIGGSCTAEVCIYEVSEDGSVEKASEYAVTGGVMSMFESGSVDWFLYETGDAVYIGMELHDGVCYFGDGCNVDLVILRYEDGTICEVASYQNGGSGDMEETVELSFDDTSITFDADTALYSGEIICRDELDAAVFCESVSEDVNPYREGFAQGDVIFTVTFTEGDASADADTADDWVRIYRTYLSDANIYEQYDSLGDLYYVIGSGEFKGMDCSGFSLIYVNNDEIPELVILGNGMAAGIVILTVTADGAVDAQQLSRLSFGYLERGNILDNNGGNSGYYYDYIYSIGEDGWILKASGEYWFADEEQYYAEDPEYAYQWDGEDVSETEYYSKLAEYYDSSEAASSVETMTPSELYEALYSADHD